MSNLCLRTHALREPPTLLAEGIVGEVVAAHVDLLLEGAGDDGVPVGADVQATRVDRRNGYEDGPELVAQQVAHREHRRGIGELREPRHHQVAGRVQRNLLQGHCELAALERARLGVRHRRRHAVVGQGDRDRNAAVVGVAGVEADQHAEWAAVDHARDTLDARSR